MAHGPGHGRFGYGRGRSDNGSGAALPAQPVPAPPQPAPGVADVDRPPGAPAPSGIWSTLTFTAAGGLVAATIGPEGSVHRITVDQRMLPHGLEVICQQIAEAVNQGLSAVHGRAAAAAERQSDPVLLAARLDEVRAESVRRMGALNDALGEVVMQLRETR